MFIFSAIGPATRNSDLNYLLSMYGEVLMVIFLYLFFHKKEHLKSNQKFSVNESFIVKEEIKNNYEKNVGCCNC